MHEINFLLSRIHAITVTLTAALTLFYGLDPRITLVISLCYFIIVWFYEDDGLAILIHHAIALYCSAYFVLFNPRFADIYVMYQLGEISTPFLHLWREKSVKWAKYVFAFLFLTCRTAFQTLIVLPAILNKDPQTWDEHLIVVIGIVFYLLQMFWSYRIVRFATIEIYHKFC
jgi:hypothetical protein